MNNKELNQINIDMIFFFLAFIKSSISLYLINEKKKNALNIKSIDNNISNKIYYYNRRLNFIIALYFFINAYKSYQETKNDEDKLLMVATLFILIGSSLYLPLGNSNLIIKN